MEKNTTARDVFMYLLVLITLAMSTVNLGTLLFQYVNIYIPDTALQQCYGNSCVAAIRWSLASLVIVFSVLMWARRRIQCDIASNPEKADSWVRRWAFYLTLFVSGGTLIGDAIALLYGWLQGDLTVQFIVKALAVLYIAGSVFYYFLQQLHPQEKSFANSIARVAMVVVALSVVLGFVTSGSPFRARSERLDTQRVADLQSLQSQIVSVYWESKGRLPDSLSQLEDPINGFMVPVDPQSKLAYEYTRKGDQDFVLCAQFLTTQDFSDLYQRQGGYAYPAMSNDTWTHGVGRVCFERAIDPELYPANLKKIPTQTP